MTRPNSDRHRTREYVASLIGSMMRRPATAKQLALLTGHSEHNTRTWINYFHDLGLCYIESWDDVRQAGTVLAKYAAKFAWTEGAPFSCVDAEKPRTQPVNTKLKPTVERRYTAILNWLRDNRGQSKQSCAKALGVCNATVYRAVAWQTQRVADAATRKILPNFKR
jgi:hypothetical protein